MKFQPWLVSDDWEKRDPKLVEFASLPLILPHTLRLANAIALNPAGIVLVRGPRQVGKSTFLREFAQKSLASKIPPQSVVLFDAEEFTDCHHLAGELESFVMVQPGFSVVLIDEITSIEKWWLSLKLLADRGELRNTLVVCTGSSASDLREGADLLPGRRGRRHPVDFELLPVRYRDVAPRLKLDQFLLTGGFPWAINEFLRLGTIPSHVYQIYASWIDGAFHKRRQAVNHLPHLTNYLALHMGTPFSVQKMSRDCGIGSNTTAEAYLSVLEENYAVIPCQWAEFPTLAPAPRKNRKIYPIDPFLFHLFRNYGKGWEGAFLSSKASAGEPAVLGQLAECLVAAELRQRTGQQRLRYWLGKKEIDFVGKDFVEVKYQSHVTAGEFEWAARALPKGHKLTVVTKDTNALSAHADLIAMERWLLA